LLDEKQLAGGAGKDPLLARRKFMFFEKIKEKIAQTNTRKLLLFPFLISFVPILILLLVFPGKFTGSLGEVILIDLILFFWSLAGIVIITRQEMPGFIPVHGTNAIFTGIFMVVIAWGFIIVSIIRLISR
jgi:hypothetical protein